eukprot:TRINITY_DN34257_c1_g1_i2.p1 TRINITY_DN34257_c1_g1~~TRINITY_DN34257_c1_g1_i2.p1  ORF type:complete len:163 (+),score=5.79 TRINITY_DN34257_c1_g1_i2:89-577(+)
MDVFDANREFISSSRSLRNEKGFYQSHPMTPNAKRMQSLPCTLGGKALWDIRQSANCVLPSGISATDRKCASSPIAQEYRSFASREQMLRRQARPVLGPVDKYNLGAATSHEIGWHADTPAARSQPWQRRTFHGLTQSESTRYYANMKATGSEASLRLIISP